MATLTTSWANYGGGKWSSSGGSTVYFWIDARYEIQSVEKNSTTIYVRLTSKADHPNGNGGSGYSFSCTYCDGKSGSDVWYYANETILSSPAKAITHNDDGTKSVTIKATATNSYLGMNVSFSATFDLPTIPRAATITEAPNFNDEQNPVLKYSNPAGSAATTLQACLSFDGSTAHIAYRDLTKTGTSYTFNLTDAERQVLYNNTKDAQAKDITFIVKTVIGSSTFYKKSTKTLSIINANPTGVITIAETNQAVIDVLDKSDASTAIKGISNIKATVTPTLKKGATLKSISMTCGAANNNGANPYTFSGISAEVINYTITDSRGNITKNSIKINDFISYIIPKVTQLDFARVSLDSNQVVLNATIDCYTGDIGDSINTFTITYNSSNDKSGAITSYTKNDNKIIISDLAFTNLVSSTTETPTVTLAISDLFSTASASDIVLAITPTFDAGASDVQINGDLRATGALRVDGRAVLYKGSMNQTLANGSGTSGYMYAFSLKMTGQTYQNQYFTFDILQRDRYGTVRLLFASSGTAGTCTISKVITTGNITVAYVNSNNTFDFYIQKSEAYDNISIHNLSVGSYMVSVINSLVWKNQTVSSLPSGAKTITPNQDQFPIDSLYLSVGSTSPASLFGGSWTQLKDRFLLAAGDTYTNGATGGAATVAITKAQMPRHNHANGDEYGSGHRAPVWNYGSGGDRLLVGSSNGYTISTPIYEGNGEAHNNMPPYLVIYVWKRTA